MSVRDRQVSSLMKMHKSGEIEKRTKKARAILLSCGLCPRQCGVNRMNGEEGFCKCGSHAVVSHSLPHFGEEPPISGTKGAGTIFFSHCNLSCLYCQNFQISQMNVGTEVSEAELARMMLILQDKGCHNIEFVSPTSQVPAILAALEIALHDGLRIPLVYNTNGYESLEVLSLLDGVIDIYLPDFKYIDDGVGEELSSVERYPEYALQAIREMYRQVGNLQVKEGVAVRGLLVRHLVLPGHAQDALELLRTLALMISRDLHISLMAQYNPVHRATTHSEMRRKISMEEYTACVTYAERLGFENVWVQSLASADEFLPDFTMTDPFSPPRRQ